MLSNRYAGTVRKTFFSDASLDCPADLAGPQLSASSKSQPNDFQKPHLQEITSGPVWSKKVEDLSHFDVSLYQGSHGQTGCLSADASVRAIPERNLR